jgi:hypothetical protein
VSTPVTPVTPAAPTTASKILSVLSSLNGEVQLGIAVGGVVVPAIVGVIKDIKQAISGDGQTIEYTVVITQGQDVLDAVENTEASDITGINAELTRLGLPTFPVPAPLPPINAPAPPATPPASGSGSSTVVSPATPVAAPPAAEAVSKPTAPTGATSE